MRKPIFYNFRPLILASKIDQHFLFFQSRFSDLLFLIFQKCSILRPPFKIRWDPKWHPNQPKWHPNARKSKCWYAHNAFCFQTLFSRNYSNPRAVGKSWFLKDHFFNVDWLMFCFRCVCLCFVVYNIFNISSVNAQPLSCSLF